MRGEQWTKTKMISETANGGKVVHITIGLPSLDGRDRSWGLCKEGRIIYLALEDAEGDGAVHLITKQQNKWWQCYAHVGIALSLSERPRDPATVRHTIIRKNTWRAIV